MVNYQEMIILCGKRVDILYLFKGNTNVAYLIFIHEFSNQQQNISGKVKHQAKMDNTRRL